MARGLNWSFAPATSDRGRDSGLRANERTLRGETPRAVMPARQSAADVSGISHSGPGQLFDLVCRSQPFVQQAGQAVANGEVQ